MNAATLLAASALTVPVAPLPRLSLPPLSPLAAPVLPGAAAPLARPAALSAFLSRPAAISPAQAGAAAAAPSALAAAVLASPASPASAVRPVSPALDAVFDGRVGPLAERSGAGLLVVDLKDSTRLYHEVGNRKARSIVNAALDFAENTARESGGRVARRLGDGLLIAFPDRESAAAAERAVHARLPEVRARLGRPALALHSAVDGGRLVEDRSGGGFDVYGQAVERALGRASGPAPRPVATEPADDDAGMNPASAASEALGAASWLQSELAVARFDRRATLFADLEDWPRHYEGYGRRRAIATVKAFHSYAAAVAARHGGSLVKTSGEAVMVSFPDAASAVRAAVELQARADELRAAAPLGGLVRPRVGVSYGRAVREDRLESVDYFGNTVNAAARLMRLAGGGGVLLSAAVLRDPAAREFLKDGWTTRERHALKGFDQPLETLRVDASALPRPAAKRLTPALRRVADAVMKGLPSRL